MFDANSYFGRLDQLLAPCKLWPRTEGPALHVVFAHDRWIRIQWRFKATFPSGERLDAFEGHDRTHQIHRRKIKYRLMHADGSLIFQLDTHGETISFDEPPHLHKGPSEDLRLQDGDWELNGLQLRGFDFPKMWELIQAYVTDGSVPWRT